MVMGLEIIGRNSLNSDDDMGVIVVYENGDIIYYDISNFLSKENKLNSNEDQFLESNSPPQKHQFITSLSISEPGFLFKI